MHIVLYQPQIPQNCGNIVRTCAVTGSRLTLVAPLGFSVNDRWLKRAGLDYWEGVQVEVVEDFEALLQAAPAYCYFFSSKATRRYDQVTYGKDDLLVFGSETHGLPRSSIDAGKGYKGSFVTLPMQPNQRCLNLATSVGIALYEAWRQQGFNGAQSKHGD